MEKKGLLVYRIFFRVKCILTKCSPRVKAERGSQRTLFFFSSKNLLLLL